MGHQNHSIALQTATPALPTAASPPFYLPGSFYLLPYLLHTNLPLPYGMRIMCRFWFGSVGFFGLVWLVGSLPFLLLLLKNAFTCRFLALLTHTHTHAHIPAARRARARTHFHALYCYLQQHTFYYYILPNTLLLCTTLARTTCTRGHGCGVL